MKKLFSVLAFLLLFAFSNNAFSAIVTIPAGASPYPTLAAAFAAINAGGPYAGVAVTVTINKMYSRSCYIGPTATFTSLLFRPSGAITISGAAFNEALIILDNADNVTINGLNSGGNSLTLTNTNTGLNAGSLRLSNGSSNNFIRKVTCNGVGVAVAQGGRTINIGQSTPGTSGNNSNTIDSCVVNGGRRGIQVFGTAGATGYTNDNTVIKNYIVKNCSSLGIFVGSETRDNTVQDCEIFDDPGAVTQDAAGGYRAMGLQGVGITNIFRNRIHDLQNLDPTVPYIGIIYIPILLTAPGSNVSSATIVNNAVILNQNNSAGFIYGIYAASNTSTVSRTLNLFYNTTRLIGTSPVTVAGQVTEGIVCDVAEAGSIINIKNNVAMNGRTGGSATSNHIGYDVSAYPLAGITTNTDYNISKAADTTGLGWMVLMQEDSSEMAEDSNLCKDTACTFGQEQHSMYRQILFAGPNTYKLGLIGGDMAATPLAAIPNDIDGDPRNASFPYKGCDEKTTPLRVLNMGGCLESKGADGEVEVFLRLGGCAKIDSCTTDLLVSSLQAFPTYGDAVPNGNYFLEVRSINHLVTFSAAPVAFAGATVTYDFKPSTATAFGNNLTAGAAPHCFFAGDRNQDGAVDLTDIVGVFNDAKAFLSGCRLISDMNSDGTIDLTDLITTFNNSKIFVNVISPCPFPAPDGFVNWNNPDFGKIARPIDTGIKNSVQF